MKTIDIVVPCYNEEEGLEYFIQETNKVIDTIENYKFRYILVNDGSRDKTYLVMKKLPIAQISVTTIIKAAFFLIIFHTSDNEITISSFSSIELPPFYILIRFLHY